MSGAVYREASASIAPAQAIVHVGDPGTDTLTVTNTDPADGYSENLIAVLAGTTGEIGVGAAGPTGEIMAGASDTTSLAVSFSTATAGTVSGTATVDLTSDGGTGPNSIDGLGQIALPTQDVPVSITVNNYAAAGLSESGGGVFAAAGTNSAGGANYTLDLGTLAEGSSAPTIDLSALNTAQGPADLLWGSFQETGSSAFTNALSSFSDLAAGGSDAVGTVTLSTAAAGTFSETVTLAANGSNAGGYNAAVPDATLTIEGIIEPPPTVSVSINNTDINVANPTGTVTFTFSEAVVDFILSDVTAAGGSLSNFTGSGTSYTATFTGAANTDVGNASVSVTNGSYHDAAGNAGTGGSTGSFVVDTVTPTVAVSTNNGDLTAANDTATIIFAFSEAPVSFTLADTAAVGGTLSSLTGSGTTYMATFTGAADTDINNASVSVTAGSWQENNGNLGTGGSTAPFVVNTEPGVTVTTSSSDVNLANKTATITFIFTTAPTGFKLTDTTAVGGTLSHLTGSGTTYTATFTAAANTNINDATVSVMPSSWGAGNSTPDFTVDTVTPTVSVSTNNTDVNVAHDTATITFAFSEAPVSFTLADTTAVGGTLSGLTGSGTTYTATFIANASTSITDAKVSVTKNSWQEINGNPGAAGSTPDSTVDTITPTVKLTTSNKDVNIADPTATITFAFSKAPVSFTLADTTAVGGTLSNLTGSGPTYTATFTGAANTFDIDDATVSVTAGSWQENNGNLGLGGSTPDFTVDTETPTVSVTTSNSDVNVLNKTATITFTFSATPASFTLADTTAVGGTLSHLTKETTSGPGAIYTATFTGAAKTNIDDASVSVTAGIWKDAGNNPGAGGSTGNFVVDTVTPTVTVSSSSSGVNVANDTATVTFTFSEAPVSFTLADISVSATNGTPDGTLSNLSGSGTSYTASFTAAAGISTSKATVSVTANSWQEVNGNLGAGGSTPDFTVDTITPTVTGVVSSVTTGEVTTGKTLTIKLDTTEAVNVTGSPVLLLNDGATASYDPAHSTAKSLAFDYTVASGQVTPDLGVIGIETASPSAIADAAGNTANLAGAGVSLGLGINTAPGAGSGTSGGNFTISGGMELELFGASTAAATFASGSTGTLKLDASAQFAGTVAGLALGNYLDLADVAYQGDSTPTYKPSGTNTGILTVSEGANSINIALLVSYLASSFVASSDGHGGTLVTDPPPVPEAFLAQPHA